jgi:hypothetical protein
VRQPRRRDAVKSREAVDVAANTPMAPRTRVGLPQIRIL